MHVKDQLNRKLYFESVPKRIVSLVPSQTELLVDLGLATQIVGVTKFCVHPETIKQTSKIVGGTKNVNFKKVAALKPDIIICNKEENSKDIVEACQGIAPTWVSDIFKIMDSQEMIKSFGAIFNKELQAETLVNSINEKLIDFKNFIKDKELKSVAYLIWQNPFMVAGQQTFINELLMLNKFKNFAPKESRYPEVELNDLANVDMVLLSTEPFPFKNEHVIKLKNALKKEVRLVDGEYFSWYGSRLNKAFDYFKKLHA